MDIKDRRLRLVSTFQITTVMLCLVYNYGCYAHDILRVGILRESKIPPQLIERIKDSLSRLPDIKHCEIHIGNYQEVPQWLANHSVDIAFINAGGYAYLKSQEKEKEHLPWTGKIEIIGMPVPKEINPEYEETYNSRAYSFGKAAIEGGLNKCKENCVLWLGHPYSASSGIVPLRKYGKNHNNVRYLFLDDKAMAEAVERSLGIETSGNVSKTIISFFTNPSVEKRSEARTDGYRWHLVEKISDPIPSTVLVFKSFHKGQQDNNSDNRIEQIRTCLIQDKILISDDKDQLYTDFFEANQNHKYDSGTKGDYYSMEEMFHQIVYHAQKTKKVDESGKGETNVIRIGLALSGGGAKCAYQAGVYSALTEGIKKWNDNLPKSPSGSTSESMIEIGAVSGTSGGALNAYPIAIGQSAEQLETLWKEVSPEKIVSFNHSVMITLKISALFSAIIFVASICAQLLMKYRLSTVVSTIPNVILMTFYFYLWFQYGGSLGWLLLIGCGIGFVVVALMLNSVYFKEGLLSPPVISSLNIVPVIFSIVLILLINNGSDSFVDGRSLRSFLTRSNYDMAAKDFNGKAKMGLVLSATILDSDHRTLGKRKDLYFYGIDKNKRPVNVRKPENYIPFSELRDHPMSDVVLASSALYPFFPKIPLQDFPIADSTTNLVDGGYVHQNPIEALSIWEDLDAIIAIDPNPADPAKVPETVLGGASRSLNHLFESAQLIDAKAQSGVHLFRIRPKQLEIDTLDFNSRSILDAINKGRDEALHNAQFEYLPRQFIGAGTKWEPRTIVIGSKNFAESEMLAALTKVYLQISMKENAENAADPIYVSAKYALGDSNQMVLRLQLGEIQIYPDYTGTILGTSEEYAPSDGKQMLVEKRKQWHSDSEKIESTNTPWRKKSTQHRIEMLGELKMDSPYVLVARRDLFNKNGRFTDDKFTIGELAKITKAEAVRVSYTSFGSRRTDDYKSLSEYYKFGEKTAHLGFTHDRIFTEIKNTKNGVHVIDAYGTDYQLENDERGNYRIKDKKLAEELVVLKDDGVEDDNRISTPFYPKYYAGLVVSADFKSRFPEVVNMLNNKLLSPSSTPEERERRRLIMRELLAELDSKSDGKDLAKRMNVLETIASENISRFVEPKN